MSTKLCMSVKLPKNLSKKLTMQIVTDDYGLRGKSRWIIEAILNFITYPDFPELTKLVDDMENLTQSVSFRVDKAHLQLINDAVLAIRKQHPTLEGVKSKIVRASILQRLIRHTITQPLSVIQ